MLDGFAGAEFHGGESGVVGVCGCSYELVGGYEGGDSFRGTPESRPRVIERARCLDGGDEHIAAERGKVDLDQLSYVLSTTVLSNLVRTQALGGGV